MMKLENMTDLESVGCNDLASSSLAVGTIYKLCYERGILKMERITIFKGFTIPVIIKVDEKQQVITAYNTNCEYLA